MGAALGSSEGERLDVLVTLVEAYERQPFPMDLPDPVAAIKFVMAAFHFGSQQRVNTCGPGSRLSS
jgi:antitoxin component HigA of HigAB toxin-antitoxin module